MTHSLSRITDELLVLRAQSGESASLSALLKRWQRRLRRHALCLTGDAHAAEDATQEALLAIARGIRRLDDPARFRAWACRIVRNKCADWVNKQVRQREPGRLRPGLSCSESSAGRECDNPAELVEADDDIAQLQRVLALMPRAHRAVLSLFYLEGFSVAEIAAVEAIPTGTVKSRLHNARNALKQALEHVHGKTLKT